MSISDESVLLITLDSCRFDSFASAAAPFMKTVAPLHQAMAPSHFTYGSHAAMFAGFTPGVAARREPILNPKFGRLFRLGRGGWPGLSAPGFEVDGRDIVDGFRNAGYYTLGTGAMGWFDPATEVSQNLIAGFEEFMFSGHSGVAHQVAWLTSNLEKSRDRNAFVFLNVGETHVPYHFEGAPWDPTDNPCVPFQTADRRRDCEYRQKLCCSYVDGIIGPILKRFMNATILICSDHGDCWGEDGLWEHGIVHPMTLTVPLIVRYRGRPIG